MSRPAPIIEPDDVDWMILEHGGDVRLALETAMAEVERLRAEIAISSAAVSYGYTRGWRPKALV